MAHKAVEMKRSERSDAEIQLSKQVVQTFLSWVQISFQYFKAKRSWFPPLLFKILGVFSHQFRKSGLPAWTPAASE